MEGLSDNMTEGASELLGWVNAERRKTSNLRNANPQEAVAETNLDELQVQPGVQAQDAADQDTADDLSSPVEAEVAENPIQANANLSEQSLEMQSESKNPEPPQNKTIQAEVQLIQMEKKAVNRSEVEGESQLCKRPFNVDQDITEEDCKEPYGKQPPRPSGYLDALVKFTLQNRIYEISTKDAEFHFKKIPNTCPIEKKEFSQFIDDLVEHLKDEKLDTLKIDLSFDNIDIKKIQSLTDFLKRMLKSNKISELEIILSKQSNDKDRVTRQDIQRLIETISAYGNHITHLTLNFQKRKNIKKGPIVDLIIKLCKDLKQLNDLVIDLTGCNLPKEIRGIVESFLKDRKNQIIEKLEQEDSLQEDNSITSNYEDSEEREEIGEIEDIEEIEKMDKMEEREFQRKLKEVDEELDRLAEINTDIRV